MRLYVNGTLTSHDRCARLAGQLDRRAADRRQQHLGRVLQRPDRRGPHLQPRPERGRDPAGHGQLDHPEPTASPRPRRATWPPTARSARPRSAGGPRATTSASCATTSTAARRPGFTPSAANRIAQPSGTSYNDTGLAAGTYYYKVTAEDAAGNVGPASNEASAVVGDTTPPSAPGTLSATGAVGKATLSWGAASDNVAVVRYDVYRSTTPGFTPAAGNRIAQPSGTSYTDTVTPGTYYYKVQAEDAAGNIGPASNEASALVSADTSPPSAPANLAASVSGGTVNLELERLQ